MKTLKSILLSPDGEGGGGGGDDKDTTKQEIKDGGLTDEVKKHLEKVRLEERAKLREKLDESESKAAKSAETIKTLSDQVAQLTTSLEAIKSSQSSTGEIDVTKLVAEVSEKVGQQYEQKLGSQVSQLTAQLTQLRLNELKSKLVREAGGESKLVMALVKGNTEEELRASVKQASDAYKEIEARLGKSRKAGAEVNDETDDTEEADDDSSDQDDDEEADDDKADNTQLASGSARGGASGNGGAGRTKGATLLSHVGNMSDAEFAKNREQVHKALRKRFSGPKNVLFRG